MEMMFSFMGSAMSFRRPPTGLRGTSSDASCNSIDDPQFGQHVHPGVNCSIDYGEGAVGLPRGGRTDGVPGPAGVEVGLVAAARWWPPVMTEGRSAVGAVKGVQGDPLPVGAQQPVSTRRVSNPGHRGSGRTGCRAVRHAGAGLSDRGDRRRRSTRPSPRVRVRPAR